ncbi:MAG: tyrosine-type recombinase/integrase, partial [Xanthobacteraceae bacterium]
AQWDGTLEVPQRVTQTFARAMKALGIHCSLHGLRHTHVSQLIAEGVDVLTISRRIGHSKASITLDVYAHLFGDTDSKAAAVMEAVFARVRA